jgi:hypothetical protein
MILLVDLCVNIGGIWLNDVSVLADLGRLVCSCRLTWVEWCPVVTLSGGRRWRCTTRGTSGTTTRVGCHVIALFYIPVCRVKSTLWTWQ